MIELRNASKRYGEAAVVNEVSLSIASGETFVFIGPSGCGKSTTLKMINRLVEPSRGSVAIDGKDIREGDIASLRRGIGYVIQDVGLFAHHTVRRNVGQVPSLLEWPAPKIAARVDELLDLVGLPPGTFADRYPRELSGGQRQRVGIARALAADPPIVLLDEPFSALDPITREHLQDEFLALSQRLGKTFVIVTHDVFEAVRLADRIGVMRDGTLVQCATPREIVSKPADAFVTALLGRHRYQLQLMTATVGEAISRAKPRASNDGAKSAALIASASVWEALERMEAEGATVVKLEPAANEAPKYVSREQLLAAAAE